MDRITFCAIGVTFCFLTACASTPSAGSGSEAQLALPAHKHVVPADAGVAFRGGDVMVGRRGAMIAIPGVPKDALVWAPDGDHFAYAKELAAPRRGWRVYVKNVAGDPINEFDVYRLGAPREMEWITDRLLAYYAPAAKKEEMSIYVIHDGETGDVVRVRRGRRFVWSPGKKRLAYIGGRPAKQAVLVDGRPVWPRAAGRATAIHGEVSWSPDGHGLAFIEMPKGKQPQLVVMLEIDDRGGDLTWTLPTEALGPSMQIFWAGPSKVLVGETTLKPRFAANWERVQ